LELNQTVFIVYTAKSCRSFPSCDTHQVTQ
jgi:hypothetical protein